MKKKNLSLKAVSPDVKKLMIPLVSILGVFFLSFIVGKIGLDKIEKQKSEIEKIEKNLIVLKEKQQTILKVEDVMKNDIKSFSLALPDSNPSLSIIYQIKNFSDGNLFFQDIKSGGEIKAKNYSKVDINFDIDGSLDSVLSFLKNTENFAPIVTVEKLELSQSGGIFKGSIRLIGYWADFPKKIPAITQPISDFTDEEMQLIGKISSLSFPQSFSLYPQETGSRQNPFE